MSKHPQKIYAWMGMKDNGSWDKEPCPCCESLEYFRSDIVLEALSKLLWQRDYPNGGSIVKTWEDNQYYDREIYRKEALAILDQHARGG